MTLACALPIACGWGRALPGAGISVLVAVAARVPPPPVVAAAQRASPCRRFLHLPF